MESKTYQMQTRYGVLLAQFTDGKNVHVWTQQGDYEYTATGRVERPGQPLRVNGVAYDVRATLHREGSCLTRAETQFHSRSLCYEHIRGARGWQFGRAQTAGEYSNRNTADGEIEVSSNHPQIGRSGAYNNNATPAARKAVTAEILRAVEGLALTVPSGPAAAHIVVLQKRWESLKAQAQKLREEAEVRESEAAAVYAELAGLGAKPSLVELASTMEGRG